MSEIKKLKPELLWQNFYQLTQIPRPSGKKEKIGAFLVDYGKSLGLETLQDEIGNILIRKPATKGMEDRKTIVLQAHMDMVPQKNSGVTHDFEKDPIEAYIEGEWVTARDTTLGADNGIGVAAAMSVLASKELVHPDIEVFITVDEETGMFGAFGLQPNFLKGDILMNLDSEDEGELYVGCAGGIDAEVKFKYNRIITKKANIAYKISLTGLKGGHSGVDIHLQRANANKLIFRLLKDIVKNNKVRLSRIDGGSLRNAIPREAFAVVTMPLASEQEFLAKVKRYEQMFQEEFQHIEDNISLTAEVREMPKGLFPVELQDDLIHSITSCPNGVTRYMTELPDVVETSSNLAVISTTGDMVFVSCLIRSSVESRKAELASMIESSFCVAGAQVKLKGDYPGWKPNMKSPILDKMTQIYEEKYEQTPKVMIIHAGLECGILGTHYPQMDMISFGPTIRYPHSPDEKVNIQTVTKFWDFLVETLAQAPKK